MNMPYNDFSKDAFAYITSESKMVRDLMISKVKSDISQDSDTILACFKGLSNYFYTQDEIDDKTYSNSHLNQTYNLLRALAKNKKNEAFIYIFEWAQKALNLKFIVNPVLASDSDNKHSGASTSSGLSMAVEFRNDELFTYFVKNYYVQSERKSIEESLLRGLTGSFNFMNSYNVDKIVPQKTKMIPWLLAQLKKNNILKDIGEMTTLCEHLSSTLFDIYQLYLHIPEVFHKDSNSPIGNGEGYNYLNSTLIANYADEKSPFVAFMFQLFSKMISYNSNRPLYGRKSDSDFSARDYLSLFNTIKRNDDWLGELFNSESLWSASIKDVLDSNHQPSTYRSSYSNDIRKGLVTLIDYRNAKFGNLIFFGNKPTDLGNLLHCVDSQKYNFIGKRYIEQYPVKKWLYDVKTANQLTLLREAYNISTIDIMDELDDSFPEKIKRVVMHDFSQTI